LQSPANNPVQKKVADPTAYKPQITDEHYSIDQLTTRTITAAVEKMKIDEAFAMQLSRTGGMDDDINQGILFAVGCKHSCISWRQNHRRQK
jgi:hypothetical protein